jgi:glycine hydroxymethyltransferase
VLLACAPHSVDTVRKGSKRKAKIDFKVLNDAKLKVRELAESAGIDFEYEQSGYPHFYYIDDESTSGVYELRGPQVRQALDFALASDLSTLEPGKTQETEIHTPDGVIKGTLECVDGMTYQLAVPIDNASAVVTWLRDLSDGYISFNLDGEKDFSDRRLAGPFVVSEMDAKFEAPKDKTVGEEKPFYIGISSDVKKEALPPFEWEEKEGELKKTALNQTHRDLGGRMVPFAGWEMPVVYTSIYEEHLATRNAAGLFDVSHMGAYDVRGLDAASFLDAVCGNDCGGLNPGESLYTHFLTPDADVIDDTLVYRRRLEYFFKN